MTPRAIDQAPIKRGPKAMAHSSKPPLHEQIEEWETWPTPTAGDSRAGGSRNAENAKAHLGVSLSDKVATGDSRGRRGRATEKDGDGGSTPEDRPRLSPDFVEALMGLPVGWTDCEVSVTPSFRSGRRLHSRLLWSVLFGE